MSWKKYGGLKNLQDFNNITVNNIVTDTLTVKNSFLSIRIQGDLEIFGNTYQHGDINVDNNINVDNTINTKFLNVTSSAFINNATLNELHVNGNIYLDPENDTFLNANDHKLGLNKINPEATLDIYSIKQESLNVYTTESINKNILARNSKNNGIVFLTDNSGAYIEFYGEGKSPTEGGLPNTNNDIIKGDKSYFADASINYHYGGILELNSTTDVKITSGTIFNKKNTSGHLLNESVIIYDVPLGTFFYNTYASSSIKTGNALTLISNDTSSNTFLNIVNPNKQGLGIGGGAYPLDLSRNMAIITVLDISQNLTPSQMIVSGNNSVKCKSTTGFNTFSPVTEKYVVDINGPVIMTNTEISIAIELDISINNVSSSKNPAFYNTFVVGVGPSLLVSGIYEHSLWTSNNGGENWNISPNSIISSRDLIFNGVAVYNNKCVLISGNEGLLYVSIDSGTTWIKIIGYEGSGVYNAYLNSITIVDKNDGYQRVFVSYFNTADISYNHATFFYFDFKISEIISFIRLSEESYLIKAFFVNTKGTSKNVYCDASSNLFCITSGDAIFSYEVSSLPAPLTSIIPSNTDVTGYITKQPYEHYCGYSSKKYNNISVYSINFAIAVGVGIISYTTNSGQNWSDISIPETLNSVSIIDSMNAIAIGDEGKILYTNNGCKTWGPIPYELLNSSGMADRILDKNNNLLSITRANRSSLILSSVPIQSQSNDTPKLFYLYIPGLFDMQNNNILDICGNLTILGSLNMYGFIHQF